MSARALAERCEELGSPLQRSSLANLETGRRESIAIHEVAVLAAAIGVPPIRLLFDIEGDSVEALPGLPTLPWSALKWWSGEEPLWLGYKYAEPFSGLPPSREDVEAFNRGAKPLRLLRKHDSLAAEIVEQRGRVRTVMNAAEAMPDGEGRREWIRLNERRELAYLRDLQAQLEDLRLRMLDAGLTPPPVRAELLPVEGDAPGLEHELDERLKQHLDAQHERFRFLQEDGDA